MIIYKHYLTKNNCYKAGKTITVKGIVVHSTGCVNKNVTRYVDMSSLGSVSTEHWNKSFTPGKCVNGFIGYSSTLGKAVAVQTLPDNHRPWGCGSGSKGSYNNSHFQFEICEDNGTDKTYFNQCWDLAVEWCAVLCKKYGLSTSSIVSHAEAHTKGYATNHGDADEYFKKFGKTMTQFRTAVSKKMSSASATIKTSVSSSSSSTSTSSSSTSTSSTIAKGTTVNYLVRVVNCDTLNVRKGPATSYTKVTSVKAGDAFTIIEESNNWGLLKSYKDNRDGWISLAYTKKV
jgi:hypothetical protein